jgi:hypothetical protein
MSADPAEPPHSRQEILRILHRLRQGADQVPLVIDASPGSAEEGRPPFPRLEQGAARFRFRLDDRLADFSLLIGGRDPEQVARQAVQVARTLLQRQGVPLHDLGRLRIDGVEGLVPTTGRACVEPTHSSITPRK